ncbi:MFS transporter [Dyella aluminiiresistens]|uniref:MFS transporter n=1 Tax=Dyella aluminiiresistens TaxID=3069105 RepID=UPI00399CE10A
MIAGILPKIAGSLGVTPAAVGQLVTVFAFAYALSSPIFTALSGHMKRSTVLIGSMAIFTVANVIASLAPSYGWLMGARILLAFAAGLYVPGANALAGALVPQERRGFAIAIINVGLTVAIALGVPLGTWVAATLSWRMTFVGVAILSVIAVGGLLVGLPKNIGAHLPVASLGERVKVAKQPAILVTLLVTTLWATGAYTMYTYLALFLHQVTGIQGARVGYVLFTWGVAAGVGVLFGGRMADRFGPRHIIIPCLLVGGLSFVSLSLTAHYVPQALALIPVVVAVIAWGVTHWGFYPGQQARLMGIAGLRLAPIALSLNASFMYLGFSLGAAVGSLVIVYGKVANLGWVAAAFEAASLSVMLVISRKE